MFAQKLRCLRRERGYTQAQLGKELGISTSAVGMYEQGRREPDNKILMKICSVFSVKADDMLGEGAYRSAKEPVELEEIISDMREILLTQKALMFNGQPIDAEGTRQIIAALELGARLAAELNRKNKISGNG